MAKGDVYRLGEQIAVEFQSDWLDYLPTRFIIPLMTPEQGPAQAAKLNPTFILEGETMVLHPQYAGVVAKASLSKPFASLAPHEHDIQQALDFLFAGY